MPRTAADFAAGVLNVYRASDSRRAALAKSLQETAVHVTVHAMGHPDFAGLPLGGQGHCDAAVVFLDLDEFTSRTFWDTPESMVRLALAVLNQLVEVVVDHGGFVLGLRGDGVFACFGGPGSDPGIDVAVALGAAAFALDATENALNNLLIMDGLDPVRLRVGADHGRLDFVRTGGDEANEVNVIGFAANFAAKCEKIADSWELVAGEGIAAHVLNKTLLRTHPYSPKRYTRDGITRSYSFHDIAWRSIAPHSAGRPRRPRRHPRHPSPHSIGRPDDPNHPAPPRRRPRSQRRHRQRADRVRRPGRRERRHAPSTPHLPRRHGPQACTRVALRR